MWKIKNSLKYVILDLIYKYKADDKVNISRIVKETMQDFVESGKILFQDNQTAYSFIVFKTLAMNELIPELENQNGSWNSKESYRYWINVDYERLMNLYKTRSISHYLIGRSTLLQR